MTQQRKTELTPLDLPKILHPSDFTPTSERAFHHALKIAQVGQRQLTMLHISDGYDELGDFPVARDTLSRWGLLPPNSPRRDVFEQVGIELKKVTAPGADVLDSVLSYHARHPADLIVLSTRGKSGSPRWIKPAIAEPLARRSDSMALFVPEGCRGFVDAATGDVTLGRVLLPVPDLADPDVVIHGVVSAVVSLFGVSGGALAVLHVADHLPRVMGDVGLSELSGWSIAYGERDGDVVEQIVEASRDVDLVVMPTQGHLSLLDALRGSTSERVLRQLECPLLTIPV